MENLAGTIACNSALYNKQVGAGRDPGDLETSRKAAAALKQGRAFFYGDVEVEIGLSNVDWSGGHIHHQEWPAQLNRFYCVMHVLPVYQVERDKELPRLARMLIEDWIRAHPYSGKDSMLPGDSTLNTAVRLGSWWRAVEALADSRDFKDDAFIRSIVDSAREQLRLLRLHLARKGNWRIAGLVTMLQSGLAVPGLDDHVPFAVHQLNETFHRQVHPDGSHEEHNPSYHSWMCHVFSQLWRIGKARPELGLRIDAVRAARMLDYQLYSTAPDGGSIGLHDGSVWRPGKGLDATIKKRGAFLKDAGLSGPEWDAEAKPSRFFDSAGQVFLRSGWSADSTMLTFDATRWGGGHCHLSRNSISLYDKRRMLLCDPGVFTYEMSDQFGPYGKSTPAHNTVNFAGMSQCEADPFNTRAEIMDHAAIVSSTYGGGYYPGLYGWGWNEGKRPGVFGIHNRTLLWLPGRWALVIDSLALDPGQRYAAHWQLPAGPHGLDAGKLRAWSAGEGRNILIQILHSNDPMSCAVREGAYLPLRGWLPTGKTGKYEPAPQVFFEGAGGGWSRSAFATLLLPFDGAEPPPVKCDFYASPTGNAWTLRLEWPDGGEDLVAFAPWLEEQVGSAGRLESDAALAAVTLREGRPTGVIIRDGMFCSLDGRRLIEKDSAGTYDIPV